MRAATARLSALMRGDGLKALALRGTAISVLNFGGQNALRLLSNIVLTRLLFPEAFGLMAIVGVFTTGVQMFSDLGLKASIIQSKRGDDPDFLNTVWTMQILRGIVLCLACAALAWPVARIYDEPLLIPMLLAMGLSPLMSGFVTTNLATARRNLHLMRQTVIQLVSQAAGIVFMVLFALAFRSVWALVFGSLFTVAVRLVLYQIYLPGLRNRLRWEPEAVREVFHFGKFIFLSTLATFAITQSDKAILGVYISTALLGIYNIGYILGVLPFTLMRVVTRAVIFPLYRKRPPRESAENARHMLRARRLLILAILGCNAVLALIARDLVDLLYDPRYALAGPIIVMICLAAIPQIVFEGYANALMSMGDSRRMFQIQSVTAIVQVGFIIATIGPFGIMAAILAPGIAALATYPLLIRFMRPYKALDLTGDILFLGGGLALNGAICWLNRDALPLLLP
ncbi:oligosaccharide flippase family protein [Poseidonocella sedimentorum]|uniref:Membrane protein involved in the export of O-antigen and teichoic acid n=1 Tax=Poseidonocella sedimentorum TaxID=871652 RepID=A0A1I6ENA3_9RHOB|nr:oligosaccharide flippase family protein [Poseidonocella sedimentorum]SFR19210.1 Membrane protein involved in the export of O-antigen and teichoic acid [Poseidonocella sedimentorum]